MVMSRRDPPPGGGRPRQGAPLLPAGPDLFRELGDLYAEASTLAHVGACHHLAGHDPAAHEQWRHAHALLGDLDPSTIDQIHTQLMTIDKSAADAFRGRLRLGERSLGSTGEAREGDRTV